MADDYVSRQWLIDEYFRRHKGPPGGALKIIEEAPAADVEPKRKTGTWTEENVYFDQYAWRCSACREDWDLIEGTPFENNMRFCPNCGAKMDREEPHED